jgi:hypothetical protein
VVPELKAKLTLKGSIHSKTALRAIGVDAERSQATRHLRNAYNAKVKVTYSLGIGGAKVAHPDFFCHFRTYTQKKK